MCIRDRYEEYTWVSSNTAGLADIASDPLWCCRTRAYFFSTAPYHNIPYHTIPKHTSTAMHPPTEPNWKEFALIKLTQLPEIGQLDVVSFLLVSLLSSRLFLQWEVPSAKLFFWSISLFVWNSIFENFVQLSVHKSFKSYEVDCSWTFTSVQGHYFRPPPPIKSLMRK